MILMNGIEPSAIMLGDNAVSAVYQGSELIWSGIKRYGGIEVLYDNANYAAGRKYINDYFEDEHTFITAIFDSGSSSSKNYSFYTGRKENSYYCRMQLFNDVSALSVDYWTDSQSTVKTFSSLGRYIVCSLPKDNAQNCYLYDNTNGRYIFKGNAVV